MEDPASFLARKAVKGMVGAIGSQYKKSRREKTNAVDLGEIRFELLMSFRGHARGRASIRLPQFIAWIMIRREKYSPLPGRTER